ncbi:MAG: glycosyltransferase family 2 protein [Candidatus Woesearchaeota archaeon]|jgi:biofilm PGA synthesis N-glycosyltransferase PgaC|nr:glycosyltransferase family 2 protein [Candidatus Woesearchaeota archaeon]
MVNYSLNEAGVVSFVLWVLYFIGLYLIFFWLSIFFSSDYIDKKSKKIKLLEEKDYPKVSVIVPCFNEENTIERTIEKLYAVDYDKKKMHIMCVNDGSSDKTQQILLRLQKKYGFDLIKQKNQGKYVAMNNGLKKVKTDYFLCLDADSYPDKMSLKYLMSEMILQNYDSISPLMVVHSPKSFIQKLQWVEYLMSVFFKYLASYVDSMMVISGPFSMYKTKSIRDLGGFDHGYLTEDFELALRMQKNNYKMGQSDIAKVETSTPISIKALTRQRIRWNYGNFMCMKDYFRSFFLKKKFQDFGIFVFPSMFLSSFFLVLAFSMIIYLFVKRIFNTIRDFSLINFDLWTYVANYSFSFSLYDLNLKAVSLLFFSALIILIIFVISARETNYNLEKKHISFSFLPFLFYLFFYRFLMVYVWFIVFKRILLRTKATWLR